jgi:hypothetical protein
MNVMETRIFQDLRRSNFFKELAHFLSIWFEGFFDESLFLTTLDVVFQDLAIWKSGNSMRYFAIPQRTIYLSKKLLLKCMNIISIG